MVRGWWFGFFMFIFMFLLHMSLMPYSHVLPVLWHWLLGDGKSVQSSLKNTRVQEFPYY